MNYYKKDGSLHRDKVLPEGVERISAKAWFGELHPTDKLKAKEGLKKWLKDVTPEEVELFEEVLSGISEEQWLEWDSKVEKVVKKPKRVTKKKK